MALNLIWIGFFLVAFVVGLGRVLFGSTPEDAEVFTAMVDSTFAMAKTGFEISIGLAGVLILWLGFMKIGERGGVIAALAWLVRPFFHRLFPELPRDHPVHGSMVMNFSANMLGLDNAATPLGLKAMKQLQELNPDPDRASNAQIMFLVLNTSGLTIIPVAVMAIRAERGAENPTDIFVPILLTTFFSTLAGLLAVGLMQRIRLWHPVVLAYLGVLSAAIGALIYVFTEMPQEEVQRVSTLAANLTLFSVIIGFIGAAAVRRVNIYETFIEGAKEGFEVAIRIAPYLIAMLVAIGVFRASGAMDIVIERIADLMSVFGWREDIAEVLPTAAMKPLSGGGARGLMVEAITTHGVDSFVGRAVSTIQGATDTTFYIIAVYFGSVSIRNTRHAVACGLVADITAVIAGILIAVLFFGT